MVLAADAIPTGETLFTVLVVDTLKTVTTDYGSACC